MKMRKTAFLAILATALALASPLLPSQAGEHGDVDGMIGKAKTASDHEAIAAHFDEEAKAAQKAAESHRTMGESYKKLGGPLIEKWHMDQHCASIAKGYESSAKEYDALAAAHREMAKGGK